MTHAVMIGVVLLGARGWGSMYRGMASRMLEARVAAPARFVWPKGFWRKLGALFVDGDAWRAETQDLGSVD